VIAERLGLAPKKKKQKKMWFLLKYFAHESDFYKLLRFDSKKGSVSFKKRRGKNAGKDNNVDWKRKRRKNWLVC